MKFAVATLLGAVSAVNEFPMITETMISKDVNGCYSDIDLIKMRNPHGSGEIDSGEWDDDGPGWDRYPDVKAALNPEVKDDGIFWVSKSEFFQYFKTIYVCAKDMTAFKDD